MDRVNLSGRKSGVFSVVRFVLYLVLVTGAVGTGAIYGAVKTFSEQLPDIGYHTYKPKINTKIYDRHGTLLVEFHEVENRSEKVPLTEISPDMRNAILAIEDTRFYDHYGVDFLGIARAIYKNWRADRKVEGASTITQQLARNAFLTAERTYTRKVKEILLSFKIEQKFTKQEILELYLNEIYFGHGAWGIASASQIYFGKRPKDLTLAEAATLAGLPKSPAKYDPFVNPKYAKERQILVLNKMEENGYVTRDQARAAKDTAMRLHAQVKQAVVAPYFVEYVRGVLMEMFGPKKVYTEGLRVTTSVDLAMQAAAEKAFLNAEIFKANPLASHPTLQGAFIAVDPMDGQIRAMVGGRSFEQSEFNRAVQAKRQPGSCFKPFTYAAALDSGFSPNSVLVDEPVSIVNKYTGKVWAPANYENKYLGPVILRTALAKSLNSICIQLAQRVGIHKVISYAKRMGIKSEIGANLAVALGAVDVTPLEMAMAYSCFANGGIRLEPVAILKVEDAKGQVLFTPNYKGEQVLEPTTAYLMTDMLKSVIERGTGTGAKIGRPAAGKTGTTNRYVDAWFCGFTPNLVGVMYVGNDDRKSLGPRKAGGRVCAPTWKEFMLEALKDTQAMDFREPGELIRKTICRVSGKLPSATCRDLTASGFRKGGEPEEICSSHGDQDGADRYFETADGTTVLSPKANDYSEADDDSVSAKVSDTDTGSAPSSDDDDLAMDEEPE